MGFVLLGTLVLIFTCWKLGRIPEKDLPVIPSVVDMHREMRLRRDKTIERLKSRVNNG